MSNYSDESDSDPKLSEFDLLESIFARLADTPLGEREALLAEICPNEEVRNLAQSLLAADSSTDLFVDRSPVSDGPHLPPDRQIGPYKLLEEIGQGGMGVVYMAEQRKPVLRKVAVKLIRPDVDTKQVLARFDAERQALSLMDHPNISKVLEAGETETGRPYFVMELVKGEAITDYCERKRLSLKERLNLFIPVCNAIQHAHQKGIIHRDIKPSNVLIAEYDGTPVAKVIDFGVSKAIHQPLTEMTMFTGFGQVIGTIEYMSPEQSRMNQLDVDTRTDIYGLGVLMYQLLTGTTPFDTERLRSAEWEEMLRIIREEDPPIPSTRLSQTARDSAAEWDTHHSEPMRLSRIVRGELDWIVMKALEKDRDRRYATPTAFAQDLSSYLNGDTVTACPPSARYRIWKFAQRNRVILTTAFLVFMALILGLVSTTWQAIRATHAEKDADAKRVWAEQQQSKAEASALEARKEASRAKAYNDFLRNDLLGLQGGSTLLDPEVKYEPNLKLSTLLHRARESLTERFATSPTEKVRVQSLLVSSFSSIGEYEVASEILDEILSAVIESKGLNHPATIEATSAQATLQLQQLNWRRARQLLERAWQSKKITYGEAHAKTLGSLKNLGVACKILGEYEQAEEYFQSAHECWLRLEGEQGQNAIDAFSFLAAIKGKLDRPDAMTSLRQAVELNRAQPERELELNRALLELGEYHLFHREFVEARNLLAEAIQLRARSKNEGSYWIDAQLRLSTALAGLGDLEAAEQRLKQVIAFYAESPKETQASVFELLVLHAKLLLDAGEYDRAANLLQETKSIMEMQDSFVRLQEKIDALILDAMARRVDRE